MNLDGYDFNFQELHCRGTDCCGGQLVLQDGFLDKLQLLRTTVATPMVVTSCCRCAVHNEREGGHPKSLHVYDREMHPGQLGTMAIDIKATGDFRGKLFAAAWDQGWSVGWNKPHQFLHLDRRVDIGLPQTTFDY